MIWELLVVCFLILFILVCLLTGYHMFITPTFIILIIIELYKGVIDKTIKRLKRNER